MSTQKTMNRTKQETEIPQLFRVVIHVGNLEEAEKFYATLLNTKGKRISPGRHHFQTGGITLALYDAIKEAHFKKGPLPEHLYFAVDNMEEIHARAEKMGCLSTEMIMDEKAGDIIDRPWGERSFYVQDPYGNGLCFVDSNSINTGNE